jgi:hypothetical protein
MSGREANHSPSSSAKVKNKWSYTSAPPARLRNVERDSLTFHELLKNISVILLWIQEFYILGSD